MIDLFDKILLLKNSDIFEEISTDDLRFVADALVEQHYLKGDIIFEKEYQPISICWYGSNTHDGDLAQIVRPVMRIIENRLAGAFEGRERSLCRSR